MIVVDASAIIEVLPNTATGDELRPYLFASGETLHVPHLTDVEVLQVLRRYSISKTLDRKRAGEAFDDYAAMPLTHYPHSVCCRAFGSFVITLRLRTRFTWYLRKPWMRGGELRSRVEICRGPACCNPGVLKTTASAD